MRAEEFIRESSVPPQVQQVIDELTADDVGSEDFGEYVLRFEGFSDWCQSDALERCELPTGDPRKLAAYEDVYQEVLDGWNSEMHSEPVAQGFAGSDDYPVQWALYRKPVVTEIERIKAWDYEGGIRWTQITIQYTQRTTEQMLKEIPTVLYEILARVGCGLGGLPYESQWIHYREKAP